MNSLMKFAGWGTASLLGAALLAGPALADGMPSRGKIASAAPEVRPCSVSGAVGVTSDYVFRGISQSNEDPTAQGNLDLTCGRFYLGVFGSGIGFGGGTEIDIYGGFKTTTGPINWDLGFIYYTYPGASSNLDLDYFEVKVGASGDIWKGGTLGATVYYSPDYTALFEGFGRLGPVTTVEGTFTQVLPKVSIFSPSVSATVGTSIFSDELFGFDPTYTYWNAGLTLGFLDKWSLDLRYWDTDNEGAALVYGSAADDRFVATVKYSF